VIVSNFSVANLFAKTFSSGLVVIDCLEMSTRLHAFMEHADDLD